MAMMIREYLGYEGLKIDWNTSQVQNPKAITESAYNTPLSQESIMVEIEGIHVGPTRNYTWYTEQGLRGSIPTWTKPYLRPLIMHHNETDGKIIGRIRDVIYQDTKTLSGTGALIFTANVPDKEGQEQIKDGRLKTVSIGAIVSDCRCSICGANIAEMSQDEVDEHEHKRGGVYLVDGLEKTCYWMIYAMEAKELSYVIVPSDIYAQNTKIYKPSKSDLNVAANFNNEGVLNLSEATKVIPVVEGAVIDEVVPDTIPAAPAVVDNSPELQKTIDDLTAKLKTAEEGKEAAEKKVEELTATSEKAVGDLKDTQVLLDQAQKNLKTAENNLVLKEAEVITATTLREAVEGQLIGLNKQVRESLIENVVVLRESLGKSISLKEDLEKRSDDSLKDAIKDLKEELNSAGDVTKIAKPVNPAVIESLKDFNSDVKKEEKVSNINLQEGLEAIFNNIFTEQIQPKNF
jgi:hypothetical protein